MMYQSSKGAVEISTMPLSYARNALNKLTRTEGERIAEITALDAHVTQLLAAATETSLNPRAVAGDNNPPEETKPEALPVSDAPGWNAVKVHMDDLLTEAADWADGVKILSQDQADSVGKLRQLLQDAANLADKARVDEKQPLDEAIAEIQDRYNAYIAPLKNKKPGSVSKSVAALGNMLSEWLRKLDDEKRERETKAREELERAQEAALVAHKDAKQSDSLSEMDAAEELLAYAEEAASSLKQVEREKVQVAGEFRAIGLRSVWKAELIKGGGGKALVHYAKAQPDRVKAFLQQLADEDVRRGAREIPGFNITEDRKV